MSALRNVRRIGEAPELVSEMPVTLRSRIRAHLAQLDELKRQTAAVEAALGADARRFADENGLTVKPSVPQLRMMVA